MLQSVRINTSTKTRHALYHIGFVSDSLNLLGGSLYMNGCSPSCDDFIADFMLKKEGMISQCLF